MKLIITIKTDNAAFSEDWALEASRILQACARKLEQGYDRKLEQGYDVGPLFDLNGNKVGYFRTIDNPSKWS